MILTNPLITPRYAEDARHLAKLSPRDLDRELQGCDLAYLRNLAGYLNVATVSITGRKVTGAVMVANVYWVIRGMKEVA